MNKRNAALGMFVILLLSYVINAMDRQLFSVLAPDVRKALGLNLEGEAIELRGAGPSTGH